jgi:hypothetical protein
MKTGVSAIVLPILLIVAGSFHPAVAQSNELKGTVTDETEATIVGATATLDDGRAP